MEAETIISAIIKRQALTGSAAGLTNTSIQKEKLSMPRAAGVFQNMMPVE
jgi:hypothetical protein